MKKVWVDARPFDKDLVTAALEAGVDGILTEGENLEQVRELGRITVIAPNGDLEPGRDVFEINISSGEDQARAATLARKSTTIVDSDDWKIIPLENLVAESDNIFTVTRSEEEIEMALGVLEKGVAGIVLSGIPAEKLGGIVNRVRRRGSSVSLEPLEIVKVEPAGMGDRVCIDTCTQMSRGEGMLVGNTSSGFFLVHSESEENPYVEPRPFRVNAGAVHAYTLCPANRTNYLSEIKSGFRVLVVRSDGTAEPATVGRSKVERRPLLLVEAKSGSGQPVSIILQNAETIRLVNLEGNPVSVVKIKQGDHVLGHTTKAGRHFGMAVEETIREL